LTIVDFGFGIAEFCKQWAARSGITLLEIRLQSPNPDKPEPKRINHENTKIGKHEIFLCFRVFVLS